MIIEYGIYVTNCKKLLAIYRDKSDIRKRVFVIVDGVNNDNPIPENRVSDPAYLSRRFYGDWLFQIEKENFRVNPDSRIEYDIAIECNNLSIFFADAFACLKQTDISRFEFLLLEKRFSEFIETIKERIKIED